MIKWITDLIDKMTSPTGLRCPCFARGPHPITQLHMRPYYCQLNRHGLVWRPSITHMIKESEDALLLFEDMMRWLPTIDMDNIEHRLCVARIFFTLQVMHICTKYTDCRNDNYVTYAISGYSSHKRLEYINNNISESSMWNIIQNLVVKDGIVIDNVEYGNSTTLSRYDMLIGSIVAYCDKLEWDSITLVSRADVTIYRDILGTPIDELCDKFTEYTWRYFVSTINSRLNILNENVYKLLDK